MREEKGNGQYPDYRFLLMVQFFMQNGGMYKQIMIGALGATAMVGAATYYVTPAKQADLDVPPITVDMAPEAVMTALETLTYKAFIKQVGETKWRDRRVTETVQKISADHIDYRFSYEGSEVMRVEVRVRPASGGGSVIDVSPKIVSADLTRSRDFHPYDLSALVSITDVVATEYLGSVIESRRMANGNELMGEVNRHIGFSEDQWPIFEQRVRSAFYQTFTAKIDKRRSNSSWSSGSSYSEGASRYSEHEKPGSTNGYNPMPDSEPETYQWAKEAQRRSEETAEQAVMSR